jgi:uncharacterized protein involved in exopolysaccharide biosynthesis
MDPSRNRATPLDRRKDIELELAEPSLDESRFRRIAYLIWSERKRLLRFTLIGALVAGLIAFLLPKQYESTTRLMPPDNHPMGGLGSLLQTVTGSGDGGGGEAGLAADFLGVKSSGELLVELLRSRTLSDHLINRFDLRSVYHVRLMMDAREVLRHKTKVQQDKKSGVISITVTDRDPHRARAIAEAFVTELDHAVSDLNTSAAHRERVFLEQRLQTVKQELDSSSKELSQFASKNTTIDPKEQARAMVESTAVLQGQLIAAQTELSGLEQIYTGNNVRVRSVQARINELRRLINKAGAAADDSDTDTPASPYPSLRKLPLLGMTYYDLFRIVKVQETVFEFLTKQYERAKVEEVKELPSVRVLDQADLPERKSWPPRLLITFLGALVALIAGIFWLRASEVWDSLDSQDPRRLLADEFHAQWKARASARAFALSSVRQHVQDVLFRSRRSPEKQAGD